MTSKDIKKEKKTKKNIHEYAELIKTENEGNILYHTKTETFYMWSQCDGEWQYDNSAVYGIISYVLHKTQKRKKDISTKILDKIFDILTDICESVNRTEKMDSMPSVVRYKVMGKSVTYDMDEKKYFIPEKRCYLSTRYFGVVPNLSISPEIFFDRVKFMMKSGYDNFVKFIDEIPHTSDISAVSIFQPIFVTCVLEKLFGDLCKTIIIDEGDVHTNFDDEKKQNNMIRKIIIPYFHLHHKLIIVKTLYKFADNVAAAAKEIKKGNILCCVIDAETSEKTEIKEKNLFEFCPAFEKRRENARSIEKYAISIINRYVK